MSGETATTPAIPGKPHQTHHLHVLFQHTPHPHQPRNPNEVHRLEQAAEGINTKIAVTLTKRVGTMWTAYTFVVLAIVGLFAILGVLSPLVALLVAWTSQTLIQLVLLPVIMVGQNVLSRKQEIQSEEQFNTTIKTYHDIEQIMQHLSAQDAELLRQTHMIIHLLQASGITPEQLAAIAGNGAGTQPSPSSIPTVPDLETKDIPS